MQIHEQNSCPKIKVACPNNCSQMIERGELDNHIDHLCPNTLLLCAQASYGCDWRGPRNSLMEHKQNCVYCKLGPVLQTVQKLQQDSIAQQQQITKLNEQCQQLATEKQQLEKNVEQLYQELDKEQTHRMLMDKLILTSSQKQRELELLRHLQRNINKTQSATVSITFTNSHYGSKEYEQSEPIELFGIKFVVRVFPAQSNAVPEVDCVMDVLLANSELQHVHSKLVSLFTVQLTSTRLNLLKENALVSSEASVRFCEAHSLREYMKINTMMIVQLNVTVTSETVQSCQFFNFVQDAREYEKYIRDRALSNNNKSCAVS